MRLFPRILCLTYAGICPQLWCMTPTEQLLALSERYCALRGISEQTASGIIFKDSRTFQRVKAGGSLTVRNFERAVSWFKDHWPEGADRPDLIKGTPTEARP